MRRESGRRGELVGVKRYSKQIYTNENTMKRKPIQVNEDLHKSLKDKALTEGKILHVMVERMLKNALENEED